MDYTPNDEIYAAITAECLRAFDAEAFVPPFALLERIWSGTPDFPMHCPEHHYLMPAVLLTTYRRLQGDDRARLEKDLGTALARARNVLGGFCGLYGACGACVGTGIFLSVFLDVAPYSKDGWDDANRITSQCLAAVADIGGPRCCKRVCYTALRTAVGYMKEHFRLDAGEAPEVVCSRHAQNRECLGGRCPYYPEREVHLPRFVKKTCCDKELDLLHKTAAIRWYVKDGEQVKKGDPLCEAEADKTVFTVEAPCAGTVARIADGDAAGPNDTLCVLRRA